MVNNAPTATSSPSLTACAPKTPDSGAGTSTFTLSVSSETILSPSFTASPGCLSHLPTVALVTLSPNVGTLISMDINLSYLCLAILGKHETMPGSPTRCRSKPLTYKRTLNQFFLFSKMNTCQTCCRASCCWTSNITRTLCLMSNL